MSDLTTLSNVRQWLNISGTGDDLLLSRLISASSDFIKTWLSRDITLTYYSAFRNGTGTNRLMLRNYPVVSFTELSIDGITIPPSTNRGPGYVYDDFSIQLIGYIFTKGIMNVGVSYQAGYSTVPTEIDQACIELVAMRYKEREHIGQTSSSQGGQTVTYNQDDLTDSIRSTLSQYRKVLTA